MHHMGYTPKEIAAIVAGHLVGDPEKAPLLTQLCIDSRQAGVDGRTLFIALTGPRNDGHDYIREQYWKGVTAFLVQHVPPLEGDMADAVFIQVPDTLHALQTLAAHHRHRFSIPVVGITGSNGKTMVKEWLYEILRPDKAVVRSPKSFNSQVGVPLSVWNMDPTSQVAIFEAGISRTGEMLPLSRIIRPGIGIFTNIGPAHDAGFTSRDEKVAEKLLLFSHAEKIIYPSAYTALHEHLKDDDRAVSWGKDSAADYHIVTQDAVGENTAITLSHRRRAAHFMLPFSDPASIENALHVIVAAMELGVDAQVIDSRLGKLRNMPMRLELKYGRNNCTLVDDTYSADMLSLQVALGFYDRQDSQKMRTLLLSEFEDSGLSDKAFAEMLLPLLQQYHIHKVFGAGEIFFRLRTTFEKAVPVFLPFAHTEEVLQQLEAQPLYNELVLVKGARHFRFERLVQFLQGQTHRTILEVNLNALVDNLNVYKSLLQPGTGVIAMVKAFSYGSGSVEIARLMERENVAYLAVAYTDEGVRLREQGITIPIMVLNPDAGEWEAMARHSLEPEIYSAEQLRPLALFLEKNLPGKKITLHLKVETGMNRLGFKEAELQEALALLSAHSHLQVGSVFSHLAASEDPAHDAFTREQAARYGQLCAIAEKALGYPFKKHLLNSSGILRFPEAHFDYVRLGIGLYGVDSSGELQSRLQPVGRLKSRVSQVKEVATGESIGYSRKGMAAGDKKIAVIALGYADGFDRRFSNGVGEMLILGHKAPVIGNVCMDMTMVDVTHIPGVKEGDEVEVYGTGISIIAAAQKIGTIPYELLTHISGRVKRVYYWD